MWWRQLHAHRDCLLGFGQGALVHLLVLVEWDGVNLHGRCRYHVGRFPLQDEAVQCLDIYLLIADDIGSNELTTAFIVKGLYGDVLNTGELFDDSFHLAHLDAEATNLHLPVASTNELQIAVRQPSYDVTGVIDTFIVRVLTKGVRRECLGVLFRTVQVAASHLRATDPQLTLLSAVHQMPVLVDHIEAESVEGFANGRILLVLMNGIGCSEDGTLGRAIAVMKLEIGRRFHGDEALATY